MNAETKLFLALLLVAASGLALVSIGLGVTTKLALFTTGILLYLSAIYALKR